MPFGDHIMSCGSRGGLENNPHVEINNAREGSMNKPNNLIGSLTKEINDLKIALADAIAM